MVVEKDRATLTASWINEREERFEFESKRADLKKRKKEETECDVAIVFPQSVF
jgi:hypothetical protein